MKSPRKLGSLLLWLLVAVIVTITFRMASTRSLASHKPIHEARYLNRVESQPSAHLVETALHKADFPELLNASERAALQRPILTPTGITILPDHSLLVEAIPVVEDPNLTWDPCISGGNQSGAWTFNKLMMAIAGLQPGDNPQPAEQMWMNMLAQMGTVQTIGTFTAQPRPQAKNFFDYWAKDTDGHNVCTNPYNNLRFCLSLPASPVHLNAIVNRIDVGQNGNSDLAGQLRFVFGFTMNPTNDDGGGVASGNFCENQQGGSGSGNQKFNIILEYNVPSSITAQTWALEWANLSNDCPNGFSAPGCNAQGGQPGDFNYDLNQIISQVVTAGAGGASAPNGSALAEIRTNEVELAGGGSLQNPPVWEMREWTLGSTIQNGVDQFQQVALTQTPDLSFDGGGVNGTMFCTFSNQDQNNNPPGCSTALGTIEGLILTGQTGIENGTFTVPTSERAVSALNPSPSAGGTGVFWDSSPSMQTSSNLYTARVIFAASPQVINGKTGAADPFGGINGTCNGCHGTETQTAFQQVVNRAATGSRDQPSALSAFLVGCNSSGGTLTSPCQNPFALNSPGNEKVQDPVYSSYHNTFGDVGRRLNCLNKILNPNSPPDVSCDGAGN
jgi:hypothetical protein